MTKVGKELLCVIFVVHTNSNDAPPGQDSNHFHEFICRLDMDGGLKDCPLAYRSLRKSSMLVLLDFGYLYRMQGLEII